MHGMTQQLMLVAVRGDIGMTVADLRPMRAIMRG
jgi:hypothetical protein